jgi:hypothetical protein
MIFSNIKSNNKYIGTPSIYSFFQYRFIGPLLASQQREGELTKENGTNQRKVEELTKENSNLFAELQRQKQDFEVY